VPVKTPPTKAETAGPAEPVDPAAKARRARRRRGRLVAVAIVLLVPALLGGGFLLGWRAQAESLAKTPSVEPTVVEVPVPQYAEGDEVSMPDLRGMAQQDALEVLGDVGIDAGVVTTSERPAAGTPGVVIEQTPAFGTANPATVQLVLSAPATVPDVVGRSLGDVTNDLALLGAQVEVQSTYVPDATAGTVVSSTPASGATLPDLVTVQVAEAASSVYLATLDDVEGGCSTGSAQVNGVTYDSSLSCSGGTEGSSTSWLIDRVADRLEATVGVPDTGDPTTTMRVDVSADGTPVGGVDAVYGSPATLSVPVTGALRLTVTVRLTSAGQDSWSTAYAVLGDARLTGGADAMTALGQ
jgi:hypothetical protein